jgi:hypothetical protein
MTTAFRRLPPTAALLTLALSASLVACSDDSITIDETTVYAAVPPPFETAAQCREVADPLYNCEPSLTLCPDGSFQLLVTDILNAGTYEIDGDELRATLDGPGDVPRHIVGTLDDDALRSPHLPFGAWRRREAAPYELDICLAALTSAAAPRR